MISHAEDEWAAFRAWLTEHGRTPDTAVLYARNEGDALHRYRARFPDSGRTDNAVHRMFHEAKRQGSAFHGWRRLQGAGA